ncbi:MAG: methylisocitrate lyase [Candidatus Hydrogenedentota bacterium]
MFANAAQRAATLRRLMREGTVALPGAINALSARLIEHMGFSAMYLSGAVLANSVHGLPDTGLVTLTEAECHARSIARVTKIPLIMDADTGYGEPANAARTVEVLEAAGVSGIHIEDQVFPKRCGHLEGKELVPAGEFAEKIAAAAEAKHARDFLLIARTDARSVAGYDDAVRRARLYIEAGADAVFPEALTTEQEFRRFAQDVGGNLLANMTEFGKTRYFTVDQFQDMGYNLVIFPVTLQRAAMYAMAAVLDEVREKGTQRDYVDRMQSRQDLYDLLGYRREDKEA